MCWCAMCILPYDWWLIFLLYSPHTAYFEISASTFLWMYVRILLKYSRFHIQKQSTVIAVEKVFFVSRKWFQILEHPRHMKVVSREHLYWSYDWYEWSVLFGIRAQERLAVARNINALPLKESGSVLTRTWPFHAISKFRSEALLLWSFPSIRHSQSKSSR